MSPRVCPVYIMKLKTATETNQAYHFTNFAGKSSNQAESEDESHQLNGPDVAV